MPSTVRSSLATTTRETATETTDYICIPVATAQVVEMRYALITARDRFDPSAWTTVTMKPKADNQNYFELDLNQLGLADGTYEYEFVLDGQTTHGIADPYAEEITRFGGYRGVFRIKNEHRWNPPFSWEDELPDGVKLAGNHQLVIYELPLRWTSTPSGETGLLRQIGLGTFDRVIFERLNELNRLGVNAIELLPVQDSADTLNWGYGSRFFFAPDFDMGQPVDLKLFIKRCHQRGIRVILDVVMNHARECPLEELAYDWYFLRNRDEEPGRGEDYGARLFRYRQPGPDGQFWAREFHYDMAEFWISNYHIDGFRIDEFRGIDHWEFIQTFSEKASATQNTLFPERPFAVIAEDSWRRTEIVKNLNTNPNGRKVVNSMWNFAFRDEIRRLLRNAIDTQWGEPSRRERVQALIAGWQTWDDFSKSFKGGFDDMAQSINYITSHDVEKENEQRYFNYCFRHILNERQLSDGNVNAVRYFVDHLPSQSPEIQRAHYDALQRVRSAFAVQCTSVGVPMLLAGEEFADCHDLDHTDWRLKMSDPIDWERQQQPGRNTLWNDCRELIALRTTHPALHRNEIEFFYFHPDIDQNDGARVFAYCRTANKPLGSREQIVVVVNAGPHNFPVFDLPWPWQEVNKIREHAVPAQGTLPEYHSNENYARLSLAPFDVRVFST
jgi:1,4-alpha-glucan branching enzyme